MEGFLEGLLNDVYMTQITSCMQGATETQAYVLNIFEAIKGGSIGYALSQMSLLLDSIITFYSWCGDVADNETALSNYEKLTGDIDSVVSNFPSVASANLVSIGQDLADAVTNF